MGAFSICSLFKTIISENMNNNGLAGWSLVRFQHWYSGKVKKRAVI